MRNGVFRRGALGGELHGGLLAASHDPREGSRARTEGDEVAGGEGGGWVDGSKVEEVNKTGVGVRQRSSNVRVA